MAVKYIQIETLTPTYIGGAAEKHFQKDIDVFWEDGKLYYIPDYKIAPFLTDKELQLIINGRFNDYQKALKQKGVNFQELALFSWDCPQKLSQNEIKAFIRNGKGMPFIPGSSLKGAISSHLYKLLGNKRHELKEIAGFFQLTDTYFDFDATKILPTKIFNLQKGQGHGEYIGGWKHEFRNGTNNNFKSKGFVTDYEVLKTHQKGFGRIKLLDNSDFSEKYHSKGLNKFPSGFQWWKDNDSIDKLFNLINKHTLAHLTKELAFYKQYEAEYSPKLIEAIENLKNETKNLASGAILRLGGGSGFHSITGDHLHDSYFIDEISEFKGRRRGKYNGKDSAKSRKTAFVPNGEAYHFTPMGFVKLSVITEDEYQKNIHAFDEKKALQEAEIARQEEEQRKKQEAEIKAAREPKWKDFDSLKQGDEVDAKVIKDENGKKTLKLFVKGVEESFIIRYFAPIEEGTVVTVNIASFQGKGSSRKIQNLNSLKIKE